MSMRRCNRCGNYRFNPQPCGCKSFFIEHPEHYGEGEGKEIWAIDAEEAAETYAKQYNEGSCDYSMMQGDDTISIKVDGTPYVVRAEPCIEYHVREGRDEL